MAYWKQLQEQLETDGPQRIFYEEDGVSGEGELLSISFTDEWVDLDIDIPSLVPDKFTLGHQRKTCGIKGSDKGLRIGSTFYGGWWITLVSVGIKP